ncbi:hypothetical protein [Streptomyces orinoci]|uniref:PPM-type phosphatase domain-containing protein n=1 Tax=Streptomyces orinoci TaxID=67339 RepID=A0ABV3JTA6_STRON|nr:hypothetical protein [Streptomyces orinoci]
MRIELATRPGDPGRPNEDFVSAVLPAMGLGGALVLLDGVTPPPSGETGCTHDVPWYAARLGGALLEGAVSRRDLTLAECLGAAISRTAEAHGDLCDLGHRRTPQATVVVARWDEERVEYLVLSDSVLLVEGVGGEVTPVLDERIAVLAGRGAVTDEHRNAEGGFFTAAADPSVVRRAVTGSLPRDSVRALAALSDGAARWVEVFREGGWADCAALLAKGGPGMLIDRVRELELTAPVGCGKRHDDASAVYAEL